MLCSLVREVEYDTQRIRLDLEKETKDQEVTGTRETGVRIIRNLGRRHLICLTFLRATVGDGLCDIVTLLIHGVLVVIEPLSLGSLALAPVLSSSDGYYLIFTVACVNVQKNWHAELVGNLARFEWVNSQDVNIFVFEV